MRKNRMMRAASALLVAVLLTTSTISGTFAKYVTEASGHDEARVAKWGVEVSGIADGLFAETYAADSSTTIANTVEANEEVVAPGTKNEDGVTFMLKGTPEVAVKVEIEITDIATTGEPIEVKLPAGTYVDYTKVTATDVNGIATYGDKFTLTNDYYPVVFTLSDNGTVLKKGTLAEIKDYIEGKLRKDSVEGDGRVGEYAPGTNLTTILGGTTGVYTLTWEWAFESGNDAADTYLGNVIAGTPVGIVTTNVVTKIDFAIAITVTQID